MQFDAQKLFEDNLKKDGINLFLGAGFSILSKNCNDENLPLGNQLKDLLIEKFGLEKYKEKDLAYIAKKLKKTRNGDLFQFLKEQLSVKEYDKRYKNIFSYKINNIITLNIDDLLEVLFCRDISNKSLVDAKQYGVTESANTMLFKIHGSVTYLADDDYYFTSDEITSYNLDNPQEFQVLTHKIASFPTLFWGVNIENAIVKSFINNTRKTKNLQPRGKWVVLLPDSEYDEYAQDLQDDGYYIIRGTTSELLDYFSNIKKTVTIKIKHPKTETIQNPFEKYLMSTIKKTRHPVRPISYFYEGGDALWSDIGNDKIQKLSYYYTIMTDLERGESRHISGIPGAGKTTLLMQLAYHLNTSYEIYYFNSLQKNMAEKLSEYIQDKKCYIFLDNAVDNLEALEILKKNNKKIIFVTAERDHKFELLKHDALVFDKQCIDISNIKEGDVQKICNSMGKRGTVFPEEKSSLFEIVYNIHTNKKLDSKILEMTDDLKKQDIDLYELYIVLTYVRYANVFATIETLMSYFSNLDYNEIYDKLNILRSSVHESQLENYDLFSLRSRIYAEASLKTLPSKDIGNVITNFLERVPFCFINRYDVFRVKAYDADITNLAFKNDIESGKYFYELLLEKDNRAYNKQQYALFLKRNHLDNEAWKYIDDAYIQCDGKIYSIVNTHAMILFENNIDKPEDSNGTVDLTLTNTFDILENCIKRDDRKPFHVLTYSKHAVKYFQRYHNTKAILYLEKSKEYIDALSSVYVPKKAFWELRDVSKIINQIITN